MHIFGNSSPQALDLAEKCGIAFQLTNIIRDVEENKARGRVYLPKDDIRRFPDRKDLLRFEAARARDYYRQSAALPGMVDPRCGRSLWALIQIYSRLLDRIEQADFPAGRRVRLSKPSKLWILAQSFWKVR
jgi:phytoene synthase